MQSTKLDIEKIIILTTSLLNGKFSKQKTIVSRTTFIEIKIINERILFLNTL